MSWIVGCAMASMVACSGDGAAPVADDPTAEEASAFVKQVDVDMRKLLVEQETSAWAYMTNITPETEAASASADKNVMAYNAKIIKEAQQFDDVAGMDEDTKRMLALLKRGPTLPAPDDDAKQTELAELAAKLSGMYGKGEVCDGEICDDLGSLEAKLTAAASGSGTYEEQLAAWEGWRAPVCSSRWRR